MKKIIICLIVFCSFMLFGCEKKEDEEMLTGSWETILNDKVFLKDEEQSIFNKAKEASNNKNLEAVILLGQQVVAGTNYMYLAKDKESYKVVIIYHDLNGNNTITKIEDFNYIKYVNEFIDDDSEQLSGGWYVESRKEPIKLEEKIQSVFDEATSTLTGMTFSPILLLGKQIVSGTNYAILCYGRASYENTKEGIYLLTLYEDLNNTKKVISSAYIDLAEFNK